MAMVVARSHGFVSRRSHDEARALPSLNQARRSVVSVTRTTTLWALAAVIGIALAAGISYATSQLTSQHIGLASEPLTAGRRLAPPVRATDDGGGQTSTTPTTTIVRTVHTQAPPAAAAPQGSGTERGAAGQSPPVQPSGREAARGTTGREPSTRKNSGEDERSRPAAGNTAASPAGQGTASRGRDD
jgi:hypothetical protein